MTAYESYIRNLLSSSNEEIILFFKNKRILKSSMQCEYCYMNMKWTKYSNISDNFVWKCNNKNCQKYKTTISIRNKSLLNNFRLSLKNCLEILYRFSKEEQIYMILKDIKTISKPTIIKFYEKLRSLCEKYNNDNPILLGGEGIICQVDESLFSHKSKYQRGRRSDNEIWVFGICDTSFIPARGYVEIVPNRSANTLLPIISRICREGTIIHSDEWKAYSRLIENGFIHQTVNHSIQFINPETGVHTQNIESYWSKMKLRGKKMKGIHKRQLKSYLSEYMWRDNMRGCSFENLINLINSYFF